MRTYIKSEHGKAIRKAYAQSDKRKAHVKEYLKAIREDKTFPGLIIQMYNNIKRNSNKAKWKKPDYTRQEFIELMLPNERLKELYLNWVESNYDYYLRPVIDRINSKLPYNKDNIQVLTMDENNKKFINDKEYSTANYKPVIMCNPETGNDLCNFNSISEAARYIGVHSTSISAACINNFLCGGYTWKYMGDKSLKIKLKKEVKNKRKVVMYNLNNIAIKEFNSLAEAGKEVGLNSQNIWACCNSYRCSAGGYKWRYIDLDKTVLKMA
jgi:hypothetical protein